jgi:hypothetical protein
VKGTANMYYSCEYDQFYDQTIQNKRARGTIDMMQKLIVAIAGINLNDGLSEKEKL